MSSSTCKQSAAKVRVSQMYAIYLSLVSSYSTLARSRMIALLLRNVTQELSSHHLWYFIPPGTACTSRLPNHYCTVSVTREQNPPASLVHEMLVASTTAVQPFLEFHLLAHKDVLCHFIQSDISPDHHTTTSEHLAIVVEGWGRRIVCQPCDSFLEIPKL